MTDWAKKEDVLEAVQEDGRLLQFACRSLRNHPEVVLAAVKQDGRALQFASLGLKNDPVVVLAAVQQWGKALQFASEALRADPELIAVSKGIKYEPQENESLNDNYEVRATTLTMYPKSESILSDLATKLNIVSDGDGEYIEVEQRNRPEYGKIRICRTEWPTLRAAIDQMIADCRE